MTILQDLTKPNYTWNNSRFIQDIVTELVFHYGPPPTYRIRFDLKQ